MTKAQEIETVNQLWDDYKGHVLKGLTDESAKTAELLFKTGASSALSIAYQKVEEGDSQEAADFMESGSASMIELMLEQGGV